MISCGDVKTNTSQTANTNTNTNDKGDDDQRDGVVMGSRHHHTAGAVTKGMWRRRRRLRSYKTTQCKYIKYTNTTKYKKIQGRRRRTRVIFVQNHLVHIHYITYPLCANTLKTQIKKEIQESLIKIGLQSLKQPCDTKLFTANK